MTLTFQGHPTFSSQPLAVLATQNVFSYLLSLGPNLENSQMLQMTPT